jgi:thiamine-monophosphate kinase
MLMDAEEYFISKMKNSNIGDDGAVIGEFIYSVDAFCEGSHFKREWMSCFEIATKAMLVNISDAIAMNAKPLYALISIVLPKNITTKEIDELTEGFLSIAKDYNFKIIGGDTVGGDKLDISITIISKSDNPLLRSTLNKGDILAFTGVLGESRRDLNRLFKGKKIDKNSKFIKPILRDKFVYSSREYLSAGMDISDGLFCDTNKILDLNSFGFKMIKNIDIEIGSSGEEYEMLIAFNPKNLDKISQIAKNINLDITPFAIVKDGNNRMVCKSHHF